METASVQMHKHTSIPASVFQEFVVYGYTQPILGTLLQFSDVIREMHFSSF